MKLLITSLLLVLPIGVSAQTSFSQPVALEVATVISKQPKFNTVYQQVCSQVPVERKNVGGTIVGGVLGAAIGNQFGGGSGRDIATAAGAVIGSQLGSQSDTIVEMQTRCSAQPLQVQSGEIITFEYKGRRFTQVFN